MGVVENFCRRLERLSNTLKKGGFSGVIGFHKSDKHPRLTTEKKATRAPIKN